MNKFLVICKISLGLLTLVSIMLQFQADSTLRGFSAVNFFSYFTVQSNTFAAVSLILSAIFLLKKQTSRKLDLFRSIVVIYMVVTGTVYKILLAELPDTTGTTIDWVNNFQHYILPVTLIFDWLITPPHKKLEFKEILLWLIFPAMYITYSLVRGLLTGWYPYDFLNPATNGIFGVLQYIMIIGIGAVVLAAILISFSKIRVGQ